MSQFTTDLANNSVGYLNWITPDGTSDGHDGTLQQMNVFMAEVAAPTVEFQLLPARRGRHPDYLVG